MSKKLFLTILWFYHILDKIHNAALVR